MAKICRILARADREPIAKANRALALRSRASERTGKPTEMFKAGWS